MLSSIGKFSKSLSIKVLVGIIILPFIFWGMGDIFRGGNQNIIATIDSEKISTQEFFNYLNRLNLTDKERKDLTKTGLMERILSEYIGKTIVNLEVKDFGIILSDSSLKDMIINDRTFFKDGKFSRNEYEKFLLKSGLSAPGFEQNLSEQEKKRQLLSFLSEGMRIPGFLVQNAFNKENQIKNIRYIDLNNYYESKKIEEKEINKTYNENKSLFEEKYRSISYIELDPNILTGQKEYSENYFNKIDKIENEILDGKKIEDIVKDNNLKSIKTEEINSEKNNILGIKSYVVSDELFNQFFKIKNLNSPELINIKNKYYIAEIVSENKLSRGVKDQRVREAIISQIKLKNIVKNNIEISKKISTGSFKKQEMEKYAQDKNLKIENKKIASLKDNKIFNKDIIKEIFKMNNDQLNLITDSMLSKNFIVYVEKTENIKLDKNSKDYEKYKLKAKLALANEIYKNYDKSVNAKYKIDVNNKAIDRIKNSF